MREFVRLHRKHESLNILKKQTQLIIEIQLILVFKK